MNQYYEIYEFTELGNRQSTTNYL